MNQMKERSIELEYHILMKKWSDEKNVLLKMKRNLKEEVIFRFFAPPNIC